MQDLRMTTTIESMKACVKCGNEFPVPARSGNFRYCPECKPKTWRDKVKEKPEKPPLKLTCPTEQFFIQQHTRDAIKITDGKQNMVALVYRLGSDQKTELGMERNAEIIKQALEKGA